MCFRSVEELLGDHDDQSLSETGDSVVDDLCVRLKKTLCFVFLFVCFISICDLECKSFVFARCRVKTWTTR